MHPYGGHNSLASVIPTWYKLEARKSSGQTFTLLQPVELGRSLVKAVLAAARLYGVRVTVIQDA